MLSQTPSSFYQFADADERNPEQCRTLRYIVYGGQALDVQRLKSWWERHPPDAPRLINMYGITETTVHSTYYQVMPSDLSRRSSLSPIGRKLTDLSFYVLDSRRQLVPPGVTGELYLGGAAVARGYFQRPDLTAERFIPNHFAGAMPGAPDHPRLYKSGDLVVRRGDGSLDYLGRSDFQVKIRGFRIELGEIESTLTALPGVKGSVVLVYGRDEEKRLAAYYVPQRGDAIPARELREGLARTLPEYMIPSRFIPLDKETAA